MSGMIRLRPTQILLTSEEVSKALHKLRPINREISSSPSSATLSWDHNIAVRRHRNTVKLGKTAQNFIIHEDPPMNDYEADSGEMSDMSDFSFGPILFKRSLGDENSLLAEPNSSSETGDKVSDEQNSQSTSWHSGTTLTNDSFISSTLVDGLVSSADEQQDLTWEGYSDDLTEHGSHVAEDNFIDIDYLADVELSVPEGSGSSAQGSDAEDCIQESYSLPMDGTSEEGIRQSFGDMNIYASPVAPSGDKRRVSSRGSPDNGTPGSPGTPNIASLPPTPPSVRRFLEEVSPHLDGVAGGPPLHIAVSRARLARYCSRSLQHSVLTGLTSDLREGDGHHQRSHTLGISQRPVFNSSPPQIHVKRRVITIGAGPMGSEPYGTNTDDSDGGIEIPEQVSGAVSSSGEKGGDTGDLDGGREEATRELFG